jgi:hypothetical protein
MANHRKWKDPKAVRVTISVPKDLKDRVMLLAILLDQEDDDILDLLSKKTS